MWLPERWRPFGDPGMNSGRQSGADMSEYSLALIVQQYAVEYSTACSVAQGEGTVNETTRTNVEHGRFPMRMRLMV
jgi:hypothetical protein